MKKIYLILALLIFPIILCGCGKKEIVQVERPKLKPIFEYKTVEEYANDVKKIADSYDNITIKSELFNMHTYNRNGVETKKHKKNMVHYYNDYNEDHILDKLEKMITNEYMFYKKKDLMRSEHSEYTHFSHEKYKNKVSNPTKMHFVYSDGSKFFVWNNLFRFPYNLIRIPMEEPKFLRDGFDGNNQYEYFYNWYEYYKKQLTKRHGKFEPKILGVTERNGFRCRLIDLGNYQKEYPQRNFVSYSQHFVCVNEEYGLAIDDEVLHLQKSLDEKTPQKYKEERLVSKIIEINTKEIPDSKFKLPKNVMYLDESKNGKIFDFKFKKIKTK